jgi:hypothetical protein
VKEGLNEGFKFNNPNEKDRCGCGESFNVLNEGANHFELMGLPVAFAIDADQLERATATCQSRVHPDRFASGSGTESACHAVGHARQRGVPHPARSRRRAPATCSR